MFFLQIKFLEHSILTNKKQKSGVTDTMESKAIRKTMNTMENILDKVILVEPVEDPGIYEEEGAKGLKGRV